MSKIPDYTSLKRAIPQVSGDIDTRGIGETIAPGLMAVAGVTADIHRRKQNNQLAKANADMQVALIGESNAYDQDPDYSTFDTRFSGNMEKKLGENAAKIDDPELRNKFIQSFRPKIESSRQAVKGLAWNKERDFEQGELSTRLETLRNSAILSGGISDANEAAQALIQSHTDLGHLNADDAVKFKNSFRDDLSKGYIKAQEPEKRVEMLKEPWAKKYLAPDDFAELRRDAEEQLRIGKAQVQVDEYLSAGLERDDVMAKVEKKYSKKPELRKEIERRFDYAFAKQEKAIEEDQDQLFEKYFLPVRSGESTVNDIPRADLERMSPAQQNSLFSAQSSSVSKSKVGFNVTAEDQLNGLLRTKQFQELRKFYRENAGSMSDSQNKAWSKVSIEGVIPPDVKSLFSATASIDAKTPGYAKERKAALKEAMNTWYQDYQESTGQIPTDDLINKQTDRMIMEFGTTGWWMGRDIKPMFEMSDDEKTFVLKTAQEEDKQSFDDAGAYFKSQGIQPDHAQFMEAYTILRDKRSAE